MTSEQTTQEMDGEIERRLERLELDDNPKDEIRLDKLLNIDPEKVETKDEEILQGDERPIPFPNEQPTPQNVEEPPVPPSVDDQQTATSVVEPPTKNVKEEVLQRKLPETIIRFRRPVLTTDPTAPMQDSYEALTLSELQFLDRSLDADAQLQMEELSLALGDFEEEDEFEEVDEFDEEEENWEGVGVDAEWDGDEDVYCGEDVGEDFLDDRDCLP